MLLKNSDLKQLILIILQISYNPSLESDNLSKKNQLFEAWGYWENKAQGGQTIPHEEQTSYGHTSTFTPISMSRYRRCEVIHPINNQGCLSLRVLFASKHALVWTLIVDG